jgi:predicted PurR-regulated permease PerM
MISGYLSDFEVSVTKFLNDKIIPNMDTIVTAVSSGIIGGVKIVIDFAIGCIVAVYILGSKKKLSAQGKKWIFSFGGKKKGTHALEVFDYVNSVFGGFINGKIVDSIIIGIICAIFCKAVAMPYATLISVVIGFTNIIPFFGPFIGAIPSALLVLVESPKMCIVFVIFILILQQFDGNILGPRILGESTGLSSFWVIFAITFFGGIWGVVGWLVGVPIFAVFYALVSRITNHYLRKRNLSTDTGDYYDLAYIENHEIKLLSDKQNTKFHAAKGESAIRKFFRKDGFLQKKARPSDENKK